MIHQLSSLLTLITTPVDLQVTSQSSHISWVVVGNTPGLCSLILRIVLVVVLIPGFLPEPVSSKTPLRVLIDGVRGD